MKETIEVGFDGHEAAPRPGPHDGIGRAQFWQNPPDGRGEPFTFYFPPLQPPVGEQFLGEEKAQLEEIVKALKEKGLPLHAMELKWIFLTEVVATAKAMEAVQAEVETQMADLAQQDSKVRTRLLEVEEGLKEAMARAGLAFSPADPQDIHADQIWQMVQQSAPGLEELAGEFGVEPVPEEDEEDNPGWKKFFANLIEFIAPLACGSVLAITLGTVTGLFDLTQLDLEDPLLAGKLAFLGVLGFTVGKLMGEALARVVRSGAFALEGRGPMQGEETCPRHRSLLVLVPKAFGMLAVAVADVTVEALGIAMLHRQMIERYFGEASQLQPSWVYGLAGLILTGPWLLYKATKAWREAEMNLRRAWLLRKRYEQIEELRKQEPVQQALKMAGIIETLQAEIEGIQDRMQELKQRLDAAYAQAVGVMDLFRERLHEYIEACETLPPSDGEDGTRRGVFKFRRSRKQEVPA